MVPVLRGSLYTKTVEVFKGLEEELIIKSSDMGERIVSRKGVKACVVLERGAMFKFPDDSRKRYFNALDYLPSNVITSFIFQRKGAADQGVWLHVNHQP